MFCYVAGTLIRPFNHIGMTCYVLFGSDSSLTVGENLTYLLACLFTFLVNGFYLFIIMRSGVVCVTPSFQYVGPGSV